jgi:hypothetical protein
VGRAYSFSKYDKVKKKNKPDFRGQKYNPKSRMGKYFGRFLYREGIFIEYSARIPALDPYPPYLKYSILN